MVGFYPAKLVCTTALEAGMMTYSSINRKKSSLKFGKKEISFSCHFSLNRKSLITQYVTLCFD